MVYGQNSCYHVAALVFPLNLICNMTMFKKFNVDLFDPSPEVEGGLRAIYLLLCCCILVSFNLICNMTMF